jgi:hypothetical protein
MLGQSSWYNDSLQAGQFQDQIPVGSRLSAPFQSGTGAHSVSYTVGHTSFPLGKAAAE